MPRSITVTGIDKLMAKLKKLPKAGAKRAMRKATRAGTTVIAKAVRKATPVDKGVLKKMQTSKVWSRGYRFGGVAGADVAKLNAAAAAKGLEKRPTNIDWLVENGHIAPNGTFVPPSGYMSRAADESLPAAAAKFREKLAAEIEKEASK